MTCALTAVCENVCSDGDWKRMGSGCYSSVGLWGVLSSLCVFFSAAMLLLCLFPKEGHPDALVLLSGLFPFDFLLSSAQSDLPNLCVFLQEHTHMPACTHPPIPTPNSFFFKIFFLCEPFFKVFIESMTGKPYLDSKESLYFGKILCPQWPDSLPNLPS